MKKICGALVIVLAVAMAFPVSAGWNFKSMDGLQVNVEYMGYSFRNSSGDPVFRIGNTLRYRLTFYNVGNRPYKSFPIESTLFWAGAVTCQRTWYDNATVSFGPLQALPGSSASGPRTVDIPKGGSDYIDVSYVIPPEVCPNSGEIRVDAGRGGGKEPLRIPMRFEIRN